VSRRLIVRPAAEEDTEEASAWYEGQCEGLGKEFLVAVGEALEKVVQRPDFGIVVHQRLRRANVRRFPYGVFYLVEADRIVVVGVLHGRRAPRVWKSRSE
jgi:toxin ParE1/3/4